MKDNILKISREMQSKLEGLRRDFHKYPELAWTEFRTASIVAESLEKLGYAVSLGEEVMCGSLMKNVLDEDVLQEQMTRAIGQGGIERFVSQMSGGKTGVVGILDTGNPGPTVGIRFDTDALPITESPDGDHFPTKMGFCSVNEGIMHSCAHDGHVAAGLGVAMLLAEIKDNLKGKIKLIFQPAEEGVQGGATAMIKKGVVDDVDYMFGFHIGLTSKSGAIFCETVDFKATTKYDINFTGKSAHAGANPEDGKSALLAACAATMAMQGIYRHSKGSSRISVGVLRSGTASNIVPDHAYLEMETRGETTEINNFMKQEVYRILQASADMYDVKVGLDPAVIETGEAISAVCDSDMVAFTKKVAQELDIFAHVEDQSGLGGSEDYTFFMEHVQKRGGKATHFIAGADLAAKHHNPRFDFDDSGLWKIVALIGMMVYDL
ncbi:MAG: amidohydrolase [Defluviitaleaceae bacterium]|nr:amidohydrolase [Defluviitaleaceae bacterium]